MRRPRFGKKDQRRAILLDRDPETLEELPNATAKWESQPREYGKPIPEGGEFLEAEHRNRPRMKMPRGLERDGIVSEFANARWSAVALPLQLCGGSPDIPRRFLSDQCSIGGDPKHQIYGVDLDRFLKDRLNRVVEGGKFVRRLSITLR